MRRALVLAALLAAATGARAQSEGLLQIEDDVHLFLERQRALGTLSDPEIGARPLSAYRALALLDSLALRDSVLSDYDRGLLDRLRGDQTAGLLGPLIARHLPLYRDGRSYARVTGDLPGGLTYGLEVEPLGFFEGGPGRQTAVDGADPSPVVYTNSRGFRAAGRAGGLFFEGRVQEVQTRVPLGASFRRTAPRQGFVVFPEGRGEAPVYDYLSATGVVGFTGPWAEVRFGRDRNRWGLGRESVVLSDYAAPYDQLQLRFRVWRAAFEALYGRATDAFDADGLAPQHYFAAHRLAVDLGAGVEAEIFEAVAFATDTTAEGRRTGFELAYLNPFQLYRATERDLGSPDNVLLGAGVAWRPISGVRGYAQGLLDEFVASAFGSDDWRNKWGFLLGLELVDPGAPGLGRLRGLQVGAEYARLRPYLYAHRTLETAYVHLGDPLGHPSGANTSDLTLWGRYQPLPDLELSLDLVRTVRGRNTDAVNFGADPTRPYTDRPGNTGIETLQGVRQVEWLAEGQLGLRLTPDGVVGLAVRARSIDDAETGLRRYAAPLVYLRWGQPYPSARF